MKIPKPEEVDYYGKAEAERCLSTIVEYIRNKKFQFEPNAAMIKHKNSIEQKIAESGWSLKDGWSGDRENGHILWTLFPKKVEYVPVRKTPITTPDFNLAEAYYNK